jgi:hypothetical protein
VDATELLITTTASPKPLAPQFVTKESANTSHQLLRSAVMDMIASPASVNLAVCGGRILATASKDAAWKVVEQASVPLSIPLVSPALVDLDPLLLVSTVGLLVIRRAMRIVCGLLQTLLASKRNITLIQIVDTRLPIVNGFPVLGSRVKKWLRTKRLFSTVDRKWYA